ncbi:hypothetical protein [Brachyspira sp.]|uniref:hypothetical protein n=1 Tax=Brachyspira sp. TaxID=1977261 RepID=UPI003D7D80E4
MKQEKFFIKTNLEAKAIILFLIFASFCICGILACGMERELSPEVDWNAADYDTNNISPPPPTTNTNQRPNPPTTNDNTPDTNNTTEPSQSYSSDTYRNITWFNGSGRASYKDKEYLSFVWTNMVKDFYIIDQRYNGAGSKEKLKFKENGDIYWEKKPDTILKKFQGGTIIMYRGGSLWTGDYNTTYGVGGVYTTATSRDEATKLGSEAVKKWATFQGYTKYSFGRYDNGGKVGIVEILVLNYGYSWNGFTWYGLDCYARKNEFSTERYFGSNVKSPEENMRYLDVDWKLWDEGIDLWFMKY